MTTIKGRHLAAGALGGASITVNIAGVFPWIGGSLCLAVVCAVGAILLLLTDRAKEIDHAE